MEISNLNLKNAKDEQGDRLRLCEHWPEARVEAVMTKMGLTKPGVVVSMAYNDGMLAQSLRTLGHEVSVYTPSQGMCFEGIEADAVILDHTGHWFLPEVSGQDAHNDALMKLRGVLKPGGKIGIAHQALILKQHPDSQSGIANTLHGAFYRHVDGYKGTGMNVGYSQLSAPPLYKGFFDLNSFDNNPSADYALLPSLNFDKDGYWEWLKEFSFIKPINLEEGTALHTDLEEAFNRYAVDDVLEVPVTSQFVYGAPAPDVS